MTPLANRSQPEPEAEINVLELLGVIWGGKYWVALIVGLSLLLGAFLVLRTEPVYQARGLLQLLPGLFGAARRQGKSSEMLLVLLLMQAGAFGVHGFQRIGGLPAGGFGQLPALVQRLQGFGRFAGGESAGPGGGAPPAGDGACAGRRRGGAGVGRRRVGDHPRR